jgi:integrase
MFPIVTEWMAGRRAALSGASAREHAAAGFFEHEEYHAVRDRLPPAFQDVLDFAYYSGWRKHEILDLVWNEVYLVGGVVRLSPDRSKTRERRLLPLSPPLLAVLHRRLRQRRAGVAAVFGRDGLTVRVWRTAFRRACDAAGLPGRILHDCRRTAARNFIRAGVPERVARRSRDIGRGACLIAITSSMSASCSRRASSWSPT